MNLEELISEAGQAAGDIGNAVSEAVRTGNYSHLSEDVEQSVSRVTSQFDVRVNRAGKSPSGGAGAAEAVRPVPVRTDFTDRTPSQVPDIVRMAAGYSGAAAFGVLSLGMAAVGFGFSGHPALLTAAVAGLILSAAAATGCGMLAHRGRKGRDRLKRFEEYRQAIGDREYIAIRELAEKTGYPEETVRKDLLRMKRDGLLPRAAFDLHRTTIMLTDRAFKQYQEAERARKIREQTGGANPTAFSAAGQQVDVGGLADAKRSSGAGTGTGAAQGGSGAGSGASTAGIDTSPTGNEAVDALIQEGNASILRIRAVNNEIPEEDPMSGKLYRLEDICRRIFAQVRRDPSCVGDCRRLMQYYLPTTEKLIRAYAELSHQPDAGENIVGTRNEILRSMDVINSAFEKLLDQMFQDKAWDIASDISVMKTMMAQDGLTETPRGADEPAERKP
ncbi:MAG: 5-bromo-4-chloroindolyl phosphate hydrolysis family protein [Lachnospiraceae bacterium]|nr:5-bromo-4-chloroindolyl phosphate hydrolysis family protein [Lachnospiraceae bacterium]